MKAGPAVRERLKYQISDRALNQLSIRVGDRVRNGVENVLWDPIEEQVTESVKAPLWDEIWSGARGKR